MVRVGVNLEKRDFVWIGLIVVLLCVGFGVAQWDSTKVMFHDSEDVKITIDSVDYSLQNAINDGLIGGGMEFGVWNNMTVDAADGSDQPAASSDGFVLAYHDRVGPVRGYSPVSILRARDGDGDSGGGQGAHITMPVKKGDTWKVTSGQAGMNVFWIPIVSGGSSGESIDVFDSGWFRVDKAMLYTKPHGLSGIPQFIDIYFSDTSDGSGDVIQGDVLWSGENTGLVDVDVTNIKIRGQVHSANYYDSDGVRQTVDTGYAKITAMYVG